MVQTASTGRRNRAPGFKAPEEYAGYRLCDPLDQRIGTVKEVFVNGSGEPEYIRVKMDLLGLKTILLPVQMVAADDDRRTLVLR